MGLPIWRDPEDKASEKKDAVKSDPTAAARSSIRRRPSIHGRARLRAPRDPSRLPPPRFARSPPPSVGFSGLREGRRAEHRGVPPIASLLESADRRAAVRPPSPPPRPESRSVDLEALDARERELRGSLAQLQGRAAQLDREAREIESGLRQSLPRDFADWPDEERRTWIQDNLRRSPPPPNDAVQAMVRDAALQSPQYANFSRSPEPMSQPGRPQSRDGPAAARRSALPTPPHDVSEDADSLFVPASNPAPAPTGRPVHPLSNSWRPGSPVDGPGDRERSPTSADGWEIMRTTITPDATLPSADSSFTSAAASHSFTSNDTQITEPELNSSTENSRRSSADGNLSDSASSVDPDDLVCTEDDFDEQAAFAEDVYLHERDYPEGRERIEHHQEAHAQEGNRYALSVESDWSEIGFRLIDEALSTPEGRDRVLQISRNRPVDGRNLEDWIFASRGDHRRTRGPSITDDEPPAQNPGRYSEATQTAAREARRSVHEYFRRPATTRTSRGRRTSPPPRYEPLASHPDVNTFSSRDAPEALPVSPPSTRSERDVGDALLSVSGDEQDLDNMRRIVERLAQRDDVPEDWWLSMGLNLSRTRARSRSPRPARPDRVRSGRVERAGSRL